MCLRLMRVAIGHYSLLGALIMLRVAAGGIVQGGSLLWYAPYLLDTEQRLM